MNNYPPALLEFKKLYADPRNLELKNYEQNSESIEYSGCSFTIQSERIHFRCAKITPTKIGQFVTFYKRIKNKPIMPYDATDSFETLIVFVKTNTHYGAFIFPKQILLEHGILSNYGVGGKRALRLYPKWDTAENSQAKKSQLWQLKQFIELNKPLNT